MSDAPEPIPAATVVIFRTGAADGPPEILMVTRSRELVFAGGMAVFPGGRVDPEDYALARKLAEGGDTDEEAHRIAAIRETLEETGLAIGLAGDLDADTAAEARRLLLEKGALEPVLEAFDLTLKTDTLTPFARWLPLGLAHDRIFDTRFYLADLGTGNVEIAVDRTENTNLFWITAQDALDRADRGDIKLIFPTRRNLERLAQFASFADAKAHADAHPQRTITPEIVEVAGVQVLRIPDDLGYPVTEEEFTVVRRG
ncbi:NUDIX domain-containing protein [Erythrobacter litoralis]|uniref:NUDIX hydrolase n=1 Tax=Erythrobacter litoralis TaxID=39960 RepID=UPI0024358BE5|nr:NUDIX domain-containing protein [Erythrobacter litoralis]MDG6077774.1 NUDIX domain-containing protein [Erythrobacter litoralis]